MSSEINLTLNSFRTCVEYNIVHLHLGSIDTVNNIKSLTIFNTEGHVFKALINHIIENCRHKLNFKYTMSIKSQVSFTSLTNASYYTSGDYLDLNFTFNYYTDSKKLKLLLNFEYKGTTYNINYEFISQLYKVSSNDKTFNMCHNREIVVFRELESFLKNINCML